MNQSGVSDYLTKNMSGMNLFNGKVTPDIENSWKKMFNIYFITLNEYYRY